MSVNAVIAEGTTIAPAKTCLMVPAINPNAAPSVGLIGAGSMRMPYVFSRTALVLLRGSDPKTERDRLKESTIGSRTL